MGPSGCGRLRFILTWRWRPGADHRTRRGAWYTRGAGTAGRPGRATAAGATHGRRRPGRDRGTAGAGRLDRQPGLGTGPTPAAGPATPTAARRRRVGRGRVGPGGGLA